MFDLSLRSSIGVELLMKMGWKEGQGVGPRVKRKARRQQMGKCVIFTGTRLLDQSEKFSL